MCELYEHIFSTNEQNKLICEKCSKTYNDYLEDVDVHKNNYRGVVTGPVKTEELSG